LPTLLGVRTPGRHSNRKEYCVTVQMPPEEEQSAALPLVVIIVVVIIAVVGVAVVACRRSGCALKRPGNATDEEETVALARFDHFVTALPRLGFRGNFIKLVSAMQLIS
jgi:hypothetical protein